MPRLRTRTTTTRSCSARVGSPWSNNCVPLRNHYNVSYSKTSHSISSKLFSAFVQVAKRNTTFCPNQITSYIIHRKRQGYESITTGNVRARARVTLGNMFDTNRNLCANMLLAATADLLRTLFHFVGGRRYLQCFAASSSAAKTRGIGRTEEEGE